MLLKGYSDFTLKEGGPPFRHGTPDDNLKFAHFRLQTDISGLFPYINKIASSASFFPKLPFIRFVLDGFWCGLHPTSGVCASFIDRQQALDFMERLLDFINEINHRRDELEPNYRTWNPVPPLDIFKLLPRTNCRACGYPSCMAFAVALSQQKTGPECCPGFRSPMSAQIVYPLIDHQGKVISTVTLEFDPGKVKHNLRPDQQSGHGATCQDQTAQSDDCPVMPLSGREREVLRMVAQGATNLEIAGFLKISSHTVKTHIIRIFDKLGVNDRTQAAVWAVRHNLL